MGKTKFEQAEELLKLIMAIDPVTRRSVLSPGMHDLLDVYTKILNSQNQLIKTDGKLIEAAGRESTLAGILQRIFEGKGKRSSIEEYVQSIQDTCFAKAKTLEEAYPFFKEIADKLGVG